GQSGCECPLAGSPTGSGGNKKARPRSGSEDERCARGTTSFCLALTGQTLGTAMQTRRLLYNRSTWRGLLAGTAFFSHLKGGECRTVGIGLTAAACCGPRPTLWACVWYLVP